jgi:hypothetical protein
MGGLRRCSISMYTALVVILSIKEEAYNVVFLMA